MENERNHKEKYPFETFLKDREKSTRELALDWWKSLKKDNDESVRKKLYSKYKKLLKLDTWKNRQYFDLTSREIEQIYHNEVIEPKLQECWQESQVNKRYPKLALEWWKSLSNYVHENDKHSKEYYFTKFQLGNFTTARFYNELTEKEIETIWRKEVGDLKLHKGETVDESYPEDFQKAYLKPDQEQLPVICLNCKEIHNKQIEQCNCGGKSFQITHPSNFKQFKEGNDALFKAYINKFSQEYKARMLQILIDDLGVRALVDESLRSK
jgi:hypothetical protein